MNTVREMLDSGTKEQIEQMLVEWRRIYDPFRPEEPKLSDVEILAALDKCGPLSDRIKVADADSQEEFLLWSGKEYLWGNWEIQSGSFTFSNQFIPT